MQSDSHSSSVEAYKEYNTFNTQMLNEINGTNLPEPPIGEGLNPAEYNEELLTQYHFPGYNYMGPGTHIKSNLLKGIQPVNQTDAAALIHDIEYLHYPDQIVPDNNMLRNAEALKAPFLKIIFGLKNLGNLKVSDYQNEELYQQLRYLVDRSDNFKSLRKYQLKWSDGSEVSPDSFKRHFLKNPRGG